MKTFLLLFACAFVASAQSTAVPGNRTFTGAVDMSGATLEKSRQGSSLPGTCGTGEEFLVTGSTPYMRFFCTATNTWTLGGVPFAAVQNLGTDVICAHGSDTIAGLTCNNSADGTAETAFTTTITLPAGTLANNTVPLRLGIGIITSSSAPTLNLKIRFGTISGTLVYATTGSISNNGWPYRTATANCAITAAGAASGSTPIWLSCAGNFASSSAAALANDVPTSGALTTPVVANAPITVTVTATWGLNTVGNAVWLYSISPL